MGNEEGPIILDVNVVISALISPKGPTARLLLKLLERSVYVPDIALYELEKHFIDVVKRKTKNESFMLALLHIVLSGVKIIGEESYKNFLPQALSLVRDPADAPYVAAALHLAKTHKKTTILTFNKKDFCEEPFKEKNIHLLELKDLQTQVK